MQGFFELFSRRRHVSDSPAAVPAGHPQPPEIRGSAASPGTGPASATDDRRLASVIARAARKGHSRMADRLSIRALPRLHASTCLTEEVARHHLRQKRPHRAINILDASPRPTDSRRMLRALALVEAGRRDEAMLDLASWARDGAAPIDALLMLAEAAWDTGDHCQALELLHRSLTIAEDPRSIELLMLLAIERNRPLSARRWFERLRESRDMLLNPAPLRVLGALLDLRGEDVTPRVTPRQVRTLAMEIGGNPGALDALVRRAISSKRPALIELVHDAAMHADAEISQTAAGAAARVQCLTALGRHGEAAALLREARAAHPLSAVLARLENTYAAADRDRIAGSWGEETPHEARQEERERAA